MGHPLSDVQAGGLRLLPIEKFCVDMATPNPGLHHLLLVSSGVSCVQIFLELFH